MIIQPSPIAEHPTRRISRLIWAGVFAAILPAAMLLAADLERANSSKPTSPTTPAPSATAPATRTSEQRKQDEINRVMEFFRLTQPDVYEQAKTLRDTDQAKFEKLVMGTAAIVNKLEGIKKKNPKLFEVSMQEMQLNYQSLRIAHELKRTDLPASDRKSLTTELAAVVAAEFDVQQQIRQLEIEDLRKKVTDLDNAVHARQDDKGNVIHKRVEDLTERMPRLEW